MEKPTVKKTDYRPKRYYDYTLLFITLMLVGIGLVMIYSTSSYYAVKQKFGSAGYFFFRQMLAAILGLVFMIVVSLVDYKIYGQIKTLIFKKKIHLVYLVYFVCILLQLLVFAVGKEVKGAKRWIELPVVGSFQPSELTKIGVILITAYLISRFPRKLDNILCCFLLALPAFFAAGLVILENVSTAFIILAIAFVIFLVVGRKKWYFLLAAALGVLGAVLILKFGSGFRMARVQAWKNIETDPDGYQILQGLYAIASGGLFGKGLGNSAQKLGYIPEAHNDMIFSVICEELGLVGGIVVILFYALMLWRLFVIASNARDLFGSLICVGIMTHIALQLIINIMVVTNTIPATGIPLPFISYGGTSLVVLMGEMGLALSVSNRIEYER